MELFQRYEIIERDGEYHVTLYIDPMLTEFAGELGEVGDKRKTSLRQAARDYVKKKILNKKIATVSIVSGTMLLSSFPFQSAHAHEANFNMSYVYFGGTQTYINQVERTKGNLNVVSPSYFDLNSDGTLKITGQWDANFVSEMHNRGIRVVPFLSNHWNRELGRSALANREVLSQQIADFIIKNNIDGVNIDIENVTDIDRDAYTDLVRLVREKVPSNKEVSVAVAANPSGWTKGWHGSYDYNALSKYADYLMIMAYDESYYGGPEGPVASYPWVERSIQYALNQNVPKEKIVMGIPFFGRYWKEGVATGGYGIQAHTVDTLVQKYNGTVSYDPVKRSPKATITIQEGQETTIVHGRELTAGTYHIWYENDQSIKAKIDLVHKYELKGTGSWSLGGEDPSIWNNYKLWMTTHDGAVTAPVAEPAPAPVTTTPTPAPAAAPLVIPTTFPLLKIGSKGTVVTSLQSGLKQLGFYKGNVSGSYDWGTRAAVIQFQKSYRLSVDGLAGKQTQTKLYALLKQRAAATTTPVQAASPALAPAAAPIAIPATFPLLKIGSKGTAVTSLQNGLKQLGIYKGNTTGTYDWGTRAAVIQFQKSYRLSVDGLAGKQTQTKLYGLLKQREATTTAPATAPAPAPAVKPAAAPIAIPTTFPLLKIGSKGTAVTSLQNGLKQLGIYKGNITGTYDSGTRAAVVQFQRQHKLLVDGLAGKQTQGLLYKLVR